MSDFTVTIGPAWNEEAARWEAVVVVHPCEDEAEAAHLTEFLAGVLARELDATWSERSGAMVQ